MTTPVIWLPGAKEHLRNILNELYEIRTDLPDRWTDQLDKKLTLLQEFPEMGKLVPKHGLFFYREILVGNYRVRYVYLGETIYLISIRHQASNASD